MASVTKERSDADRRYSELLKALGEVSEDVRKLAWDLDCVVGERGGEIRDAAIAEALGGVVMEGKIQLPGSTIDDWEITAFVPPHKPLNPSFDDCGCAWGRKVWEDELQREKDHNGPFSYGSMTMGERLHDTMLDLDGPRPLATITELLVHIHDYSTPRKLCIADVFAQHNWRDPVTMHDLALELDRVWEKSLKLERLA